MASISLALAFIHYTIYKAGRTSIPDFLQMCVKMAWFQIDEEEWMVLRWKDGVRDWWMMWRLKWEETDRCYLLAMLHTVLDQHRAQCLYPQILSFLPSWDSQYGPFLFLHPSLRPSSSHLLLCFYFPKYFYHSFPHFLSLSVPFCFSHFTLTHSVPLSVHVSVSLPSALPGVSVWH